MTDELFDYDTYGDELDLTPFKFKLGGAARELPHFSTLTAAQGLAIDRGEVREVLTEVGGEDLADLMLNAPGFRIDKLMGDWEKAASLKPGKSKASSRS